MSVVLYQLVGTIAINFIDNLLIYASTVGEMLLRLDIVFDRLEQANLMAGYKNVKLFRNKVVFLGFLVDAHGIRPDPHKATAFETSPPARTYYELRRLLEFLQFHSQLAPRLAIRLARITTLLEGTTNSQGRKP